MHRDPLPRTLPDRAGDPHSPRLLGFWRLQFLNAYDYAREAREPGTVETFAPDIPEDRLDRLFDPSWLLIRAFSAVRLIVIVGTCVRLR